MVHILGKIKMTDYYAIAVRQKYIGNLLELLKMLDLSHPLVTMRRVEILSVGRGGRQCLEIRLLLKRWKPQCSFCDLLSES